MRVLKVAICAIVNLIFLIYVNIYYYLNVIYFLIQF